VVSLALAMMIAACGKDNPTRPQPQVPALSFSLRPAIPLSNLWSTIAVGDFNGDGRVDIAASSSDSLLIYVLLGRGDGSFDPASRIPIPTDATLVPGVVAGDWDDDGRLDLACNGTGTTPTYFLYGNGDGTFAIAPIPGAPNLRQASPSIGDVNGDGIDDYIGLHGDSVSVILGSHGRSSLIRVVTYAPSGASSFAAGTCADFDGNGTLDYAVASSPGGTSNVLVYYGNGDGTFQLPISLTDAGWDEGICSVRRVPAGAGRDIAVAHALGGSVGVHRRSSGTFVPEVTYTTGQYTRDVEAADFNQDGLEDLAVASQSTNSVAILLGHSDGTFAAASYFNAGSQPNWLATADFNGDGLPDIAALGYHAVYVLANTNK
jgi:hypothetical protein